MLAFCHIPKAAGTSVRQVLRSWYGPRHYDIPQTRGRFNFVDAQDLDWIQRRWPGLQSIASHNLSPARELSTSRRRVDWFTFLREPIRRYISFYQYYVNTNWGYELFSFDEFLEKEYYFDNQVKMIAGAPDLDRAKELLRDRVAVVGLQEEIEDSMKMLASFTGKVYFPELLKRKNAARSRDIEATIHRDLGVYETRLRRANELDLELYRYVKTELFPEHRARYLATDKVTPEMVRSARWRMKANWLASYVVRNAVRKPLRKKPFRLVGFGNAEL